MDIADITDEEIEPVVALWDACGLLRPWNDPRADIALARRTETSTVLVGRVEERVAATAMVGSDGHRGWLYYLAVEPARQRYGLGAAMMSAAEAWLQNKGLPKVQLMVRADNAAASAFYARLGYTLEPVTVWSRRF